MRRLFRNDRRSSLCLRRRRRQLEGDRSRPARSLIRRSPNVTVIRVVLPANLRALAHISGETHVTVDEPITQRTVLEAVEALYPQLLGTIRDQVTQKRRPFIRFFACEQDLSHDSPDTPLPDAVISGAEPLLIVGAMAGG